MLEQVLRDWYQRWFVNSFSKFIGKYVTPIKITLLAGIIGICIIPALAYQQGTLAIILLLISGYLDTVDGTVARIYNQSTEFGSMLDILIDRSVEFSVILGLWLAYPDNRSLMCIVMLGSILLCVTSFLVAGIFISNHSHKSFYYSPGIIERAEAFIFFILMIILPQKFIFLSSVFSLLILATTIIRVYEFAKITQDYKI